MWEILAPAKINLFLEVLGRRADGYHDIRSVVVPISIHDVLRIEKTDGALVTETAWNGSLHDDDPCATDPECNLVMRAARALKNATGYKEGARLTLEKRIPAGGGLGGGSADAAATLAGLNAAWGTGLSRERLMALGAEVGCDVPALVHGGAVLMEGRGDQISAIRFRLSAFHLVVVNPCFSVCTRDIYSRYTPSLTSERPDFRNMVSALEAGDVAAAGRLLFNGLQETVFRKYPLIEMTAEALRKAGSSGVLLCGSGASVFGLVRDEAHARAVAERVGTDLGAPAWIRTARALPDGVMVAHGPLEARV